jgi:hypothetical protein
VPPSDSLFDDVFNSPNSGIDNDMFKTFKMITNENGFSYEDYEVTTSDGYILKLYRIPGTLEE